MYLLITKSFANLTKSSADSAKYVTPVKRTENSSSKFDGCLKKIVLW